MDEYDICARSHPRHRFPATVASRDVEDVGSVRAAARLVRVAGGRVVIERSIGVGGTQCAIDIRPVEHPAPAIRLDRAAPTGIGALVPQLEDAGRTVFVPERVVREVAAVIDHADDHAPAGLGNAGTAANDRVRFAQVFAIAAFAIPVVVEPARRLQAARGRVAAHFHDVAASHAACGDVPEAADDPNLVRRRQSGPQADDRIDLAIVVAAGKLFVQLGVHARNHDPVAPMLDV